MKDSLMGNSHGISREFVASNGSFERLLVKQDDCQQRLFLVLHALADVIIDCENSGVSVSLTYFFVMMRLLVDQKRAKGVNSA